MTSANATASRVSAVDKFVSANSREVGFLDRRHSCHVGDLLLPESRHEPDEPVVGLGLVHPSQTTKPPKCTLRDMGIHTRDACAQASMSSHKLLMASGAGNVVQCLCGVYE